MSKSKLHDQSFKIDFQGNGSKVTLAYGCKQICQKVCRLNDKLIKHVSLLVKKLDINDQEKEIVDKVQRRLRIYVRELQSKTFQMASFQSQIEKQKEIQIDPEDEDLVQELNKVQQQFNELSGKIMSRIQNMERILHVEIQSEIHGLLKQLKGVDKIKVQKGNQIFPLNLMIQKYLEARKKMMISLKNLIDIVEENFEEEKNQSLQKFQKVYQESEDLNEIQESEFMFLNSTEQLLLE